MYTLQLLHANDLEGGIDALDSAPNFAAIVDALEDDFANTLVVSAGDNYIPGPFFDTAADFSMGGTLTDGYVRYFTEIEGLDEATVTALLDLGRGGGRIDISIMNIIGFDASAVGNHEFDNGTNAFAEIIGGEDDEGLIAWTGSFFPYLSSNLDFSGDGALSGLFTNQILDSASYDESLADLAAGNIGPSIAPATTVDVNGEMIGIVGATTQLIETISSVGGVDETTGNANNMAALAAVIQPQIDALIAQGVNKIIVTSHLQQIDLEKELAGLLTGVDIIIAGGSNTLQADATDALNDGDTADETYPFLTTDGDGNPVAIVSTDGEYSYVGRLVVDFDDNGVLIPTSIDENVSGAFATNDAGLTSVLAQQVILGAQSVEMSEAQEVANVPDTASTASFDVYLEGNVLVLEGSYENLTSDITGLHIHNAAAGVNGGVVFPIPFEDNADGSGSFFGRFILDAAQLAEFNAGNFYVNLHTTTNPGGELRGQMPDAAGLGDVTPSVEAGLALSTSADIVGDLTEAVSGIVAAADAVIFGENDVFLEGRRGAVRTEETNLGNLSADANLAAAQAADATVTVSFKNGGGIRAAIGEIDINGNENGGDGLVSQLDLQNALRFNNDLTLVTLTAEGFLMLLEHAVADTDTDAGRTPGRFPQIGGFRFSFDEEGTAQQLAVDANGDYIVDPNTGMPQVAVAGNRIQTVAIVDPVTGEDIVIVENGALTDAAPASIRMVTLDFLVENNGDGYPFQELATDIQYVTQDGNTTPDGSAANILEEQEALGNFMAANHPEGGDPFAAAETTVFNDARIVQLALNGGIDRILLDEGDSALDVSIASQLATSGNEGATEVIVTENGQAFVTNGDADAIDVFDIATGTLVRSIDLGAVIADFDGVQSVAVNDGLIAAAISREDSNGDAMNGVVGFFDLQGTLLAEVEVGNLPDMVTFTPDGMKVLVANEGEPTGGTNPEGSISIIDLSSGVAAATVMTADFSAFNGQEAALSAAGVLLEPGVPVSEDLEPEYIAVMPDGQTAWVSLQEANAYAVVDLTTGTITDIRSFGVVDRSQPGFEIDASNRDNAINLQNYDNLFGMRQPDAITSFEMGGMTYILTANEGDARDDTEIRIGDLTVADLDPTAFPNAAQLLQDDVLGRLNIRSDLGDTDGDGDYDQLFHYGARSFTIYDVAGNVVFESGSEFSQLVAEIRPEVFNGQGGEADNRSDDKGVEPEAIAVGEVNGEMFAFIGLERDNGIMVYNITDPANSTYDSYIGGEVNGNVSPETIEFVAAEDSTSGGPQIAVAYEVSGTAVVYDLLSSTPVVNAGRVFSDVSAGGNGDDLMAGRAGDDTLHGNGGDDLQRGGIGNDHLLAGTGNDTAFGEIGNDLVEGGAGNDLLGGGSGNDTVMGGTGADTVVGGVGDDVLHGDAGRDMILGGEGNDTIAGGADNDRILGGNGADVFEFDYAGSNGVDAILDFEDGTDLIHAQGVTGFDDLVIVEKNGHAVVFNGGQGLILLNTSATDVTADDFIF